MGEPRRPDRDLAAAALFQAKARTGPRFLRQIYLEIATAFVGRAKAASEPDPPADFDPQGADDNRRIGQPAQGPTGRDYPGG